MLRRKTGCFTMGITVFASDTDLEASTKKKNQVTAILSKTPTNHAGINNGLTLTDENTVIQFIH